jgi:hypothetical protein
MTLEEAYPTAPSDRTPKSITGAGGDSTVCLVAHYLLQTAAVD